MPSLLLLLLSASLKSDFMASTSTAGSQRKSEDPGAFDGFAPSASTSVSKINRKPSYDVFINHRGPDVKSTLASTLYAILTGMALSVFLDSEELEYGDFLPRTIEAAMASALLHIAIFSKTYAESPWCLAELSFMLKSGAKIIPIFYHVEPTDIRYIAQGKYSEAFRKHEEKRRYSMEQLQEWKDALYKVSFYNGQIIKTNEDEMKLWKNIVATVLKEKNNVPLPVAKHPVGLKEIVQDFEMNTLRSAGVDQDIQIVGIWGMGGSGKTTLAQELYNKNLSSMDRCSFIFDVRDGAAKGQLQNMQIQLLKDLGVQNETFDNVERGKAILTRHLKSVRVLFVFDDVNHKDQLDALLPVKDSLGGGSLIIVTTRELKVLSSWGISSVHKMKALDSPSGEQLFCWHAFLQSYPPKGFEEFVEKFVKVCNGLPLSLKVFGGQLYGEFRREYWESLLHKISRILPDDIKNIIKVSYDALDVEQREMFLDIACFFIGIEVSLAIEVWNGSGWSGLHGWETLQNKCLVELNNENQITMHDHLRDLGREIANQHEPYRHYPAHQIIDVDKLIEKRIAVRGIMDDTFRGWGWRYFRGIKDIYRGWRCFRGIMKDTYRGWRCFQGTVPSLVGLKILVIQGASWNGVISEISRELVWLSWRDIEQKKLPSQLSLKNLRVLELSESGYSGVLEELWPDDNNPPEQLRELVLSYCRKFQRFPNSIGCLKELKKIVIEGHNSILSLPKEFCRLQSLEHLQLSFSDLLELPDNFGDLQNLRYLDMMRCKKLGRLPVSFRNLMLLQHLNLLGCQQLMLVSEDFQHITKLEYLNISYCVEVKELPRHITNQTSLTELYLEGMWSLRELPVNIGQLSRLRKMEIGSGLLTSLPPSLGQLSSLTHFSISYCRELTSLPASLGDLSSLTHLSISSCDKLKCLPPNIVHLGLLEDLTIQFYPISQIEILAASLPFALGNLKKMTLSQLRVLGKIEALPANLEWLGIFGCPNLEKLPSFARLTSLRELKLADCGRIEKIEGLENCTRLETLKVDSKWKMPAIESMEKMEILRRVELTAYEGSVIPRCIKTIQKWPDEMMICTRAIPDAASLLNSLLPPDLPLLDSFSNQTLSSSPKLVLKSFSSGDAILLCYVINCVSSTYFSVSYEHRTRISEGKWIVFCTQRSNKKWLTVGEITLRSYMDVDNDDYNVEVEKGFLARGEAKIVVKVLNSLLPALIATSTN